MKTKNKRLRIIVILLLISVGFCGQDTIYRICGTWRNPYDTEFYNKRNGELVKRNTKIDDNSIEYNYLPDGTKLGHAYGVPLVKLLAPLAYCLYC